ncbi:hypothetical protein FRB96_001673 [Tulasnella sp. 330]|nr:hypothetical protein FRB96_001673 [Tulasnella sp. 330]KAG8882571.1 hypothetical protein FRB97_008080 [Tulasnella sp. 331]KAG8888140.1 hypothetical protein FRB98_008332 [Tulasnella sp. 332]
MIATTLLFSASLFVITRAQQVGTYIPEVHPPLTWSKCTTSGGCVSQAGSVVIDANWRWLHAVNSETNCFTGNEWNAVVCPDPVTCAANCALDGADYSSLGITTSGDALKLQFQPSPNELPGARLYLLAPNNTYETFNPNNQEISFDVDISHVPCGVAASLYFVEMPADGGMAGYPSNKAGAAYGTGYCDSQCPRDLRFINGQANNIGYTASSAYDGTGEFGACCNEMDVWQANMISAAYTAHPCTNVGLVRCSSTTCTTNCDQAGCDFNSYRNGATSFYGNGQYATNTVDTTRVFTVVTQFITANGTATGQLTAIRRLYIQNGVTIQNSVTDVSGLKPYNSISGQYCTDQKVVFNDTNTFSTHGGLTTMGQSFNRGVVLTLSIDDDPYGTGMLWLDSDWPLNKSASAPGVARGTCPESSATLPVTEVLGVSDQVIFSNIKFGDIGSTYTGLPYSPPPSTSASTR